MKVKSLFWKICFLFVLPGSLNAQEVINLNAYPPVDQEVITGKLSNGLVYYIRKNDTPKNRADLRLVVNAGSLLENDNQQGLAHFCEHMAFNGTSHFDKSDLVNFLESIGMKFGAELNAYTSFDETVYMLTIPTNRTSLIDSGLLVLADWASTVKYDSVEINKERGVIHEEWRLGKGAQDRMMRITLPMIYYQSQYANRLPIGKIDVIDKARCDLLRDFYHDWYRPDLMAVVVVGDIDVKEVEAQIIKMFSPLKNPENEKPRIVFSLPEHPKTLVAIASDVENPNTSISVYFKQPIDTSRTIGAYRQSIVKNIFSEMLSERLYEKTLEDNTPLMSAYGYISSLGRNTQTYTLSARVKTNKTKECLDILLTENQRILKYGFTNSELERAKTSVLEQMESAFKEKDKTRSTSYVGEYQRNFLVHETMPGIDWEWEMFQKLIPGITLDEVNKLAADLNNTKSVVVVMTLPDKPEVIKPTEKEVLAIFSEVKKRKDIAPYVDKVSDKPLLSVTPTSSKIISIKEIPEFGATQWVLANGAKVIYKKTDYKNDEILFQAFSNGGTSVYDISDFISASFAANVVGESGIGDFDVVQLAKALTGKDVSIYPFITDYMEGFSGSFSPDDMLTFMQLLYLSFTEPRKDATVFKNFLSEMKTNLENKYASPSAYFNDTITVTMSQYNPRYKPLTLTELNNANLDRMIAIYKERFAYASDFVFLFVGNIDPEKFKPLVETYIGGLPGSAEREMYKDFGYRNPETKIIKTVNKGIEPKATVYLSLQGDYSYSFDERITLSALADILSIRLRENIREDQGGVYGIRASVNQYRVPYNHFNLVISFGCAPEKADVLINSCFDEIKKLRETGGETVNLEKVRETLLKSRETNLRENRYWLSTLYSYYYNDLPFSDFPKYEELVKGLSQEDIKTAANKFLDLNKFVQVVLLPEKK